MTDPLRERDASWDADTELEVRTPDFVHPRTGEVFDLETAGDVDLVRFLDEVREYESLLREAKLKVTRETLRRMREAVRTGQQSSMTQQYGRYKVSGDLLDTTTEIDGKGLHDDLVELAEAHEITYEVVDLCMKTETVYKPQRANLSRHAKLTPEVAEALERRTETVAKQKYVKIEVT